MTITIDDGIILRDGVAVGTYNEERNVAWFPKRISTHLYEPLEAAIGRKPELKFASKEELEAADRLIGTPVASVPAPGDTVAGGEVEAGVPVIDREPDSDTAPAKDPKMGDKTPAFMAWYLAERGEEAFSARYGHRHCPPHVKAKNLSPSAAAAAPTSSEN